MIRTIKDSAMSNNSQKIITGQSLKETEQDRKFHTCKNHKLIYIIAGAIRDVPFNDLYGGSHSGENFIALVMPPR